MAEWEGKRSHRANRTYPEPPARPKQYIGRPHTFRIQPERTAQQRACEHMDENVKTECM